MSTAPNLLTPEQYLEIERKAEFRHEYFNGRMYAMSGGSLRHGLLASRFNGLTLAHLNAKGCQSVVADVRVLVEATGLYTYPDLVVLCGEPRFAESDVDTLINPLLLAEVLSPSTEQYDRGFMATAYRSIASLREFLLISQEAAEIEYYRREDEARWSVMTVAGLDAAIDLVSIDFNLRLADLYRGILPAETI